MRLLASILFVLLTSGCKSALEPPQPKPPPPPPGLVEAVHRFISSFEQGKSSEYQGMFTGDYQYEFSTSTDSAAGEQYATGWFKTDEKEFSSHLFRGYTPPGGVTLPAATSIDIRLAVDIPQDDSTGGIDPATHKVLATRVDGTVTVSQSGADPLTYVITNNYDVFRFVRGDQALNLDSTQPADANHWYIYHWVDLTKASAVENASYAATLRTVTWGGLKALYH